MKQAILIVEDEAEIRELLSYTLIREGYQVASVATGEAALEAIAAKPPELVLLDRMLPGLDGLTVCRKVRANPKTAGLPVIILTAKGEETDIVAGLNIGANDYITKPFNRNVLLARIRAVFRTQGLRSEADAFEKADAEIRIHNLALHPGRHTVTVDEQPVELSATEFRLLQILAGKPGWVFSRQQILDALHGDTYAITERAVDVHIVSLRRKLGAAGRYIETVRGVGYRFKD